MINELIAKLTPQYTLYIGTGTYQTCVSDGILSFLLYAHSKNANGDPERMGPVSIPSSAVK